MSRIRQISEGLSDILRIYEATDSENTKSNTSGTEGSSFNDSFSSISENSKPVSQNGYILQEEKSITNRMMNESSEEIIELVSLTRS